MVAKRQVGLHWAKFMLSNRGYQCGTLSHGITFKLRLCNTKIINKDSIEEIETDIIEIRVSINWHFRRFLKGVSRISLNKKLPKF